MILDKWIMEDKDIGLIERYLLDELNEEERAGFEERRATDADFRREVEEYEKTARLIRLSGRQELKARLAEQGRRLDAEKASAGSRPRWWIALAILAILAPALWFLGKKMNPVRTEKPGSEHVRDSVEMIAPVSSDSAEEVVPQSPTEENRFEGAQAAGRSAGTDKLFAAYFQPYKDESMELSVRGEGALTPEEQFRQYYWEGEYRLALESFEAMGEYGRSNDNLLFLKANCLLHAGRGEEAAILLEGIIREGRSRFRSQAPWYLALSRLQSGEKEVAETLLRRIAADPGSPRQADADRLLKALQ